MKSTEPTPYPTESQSVVFTLPDKRTFDGTVTRTGINEYELAVDELPEEPFSLIERLEAQAKKEDDRYLFLNVRLLGRNMHSGRTGSSSTTIFTPTITLFTNDPDNPFSLTISSLGSNVENLDLWLGDSLFSFHNPMHMEDTMDYKLQNEVGAYKFKDFTLTLC